MITKRYLIAGLVLLALLTIHPRPAFAQGTAFTYQGRLNSGAAPANGSYDFRFRLAADALGNTYLGSALLTNALPVSGGLFTVALDFGSAPFDGTGRWLEIDVRTNGGSSYTTLAPLQALSPVPYAVMAGSASNLLGTLPAAQLSGTVLNASLPASPSFLGTVAASAFSGSGAGLTNVNAATLNGLGAGSFWQVGGNNVATGQFLGSTNNQPLELWVNGQRALRLEPNTSGAPNVIGGSPYNYVSNGVVGATISGGGATNYAGSVPNIVTGNFATVGGGYWNTAGGESATLSGGYYNTASGSQATLGGGYANTASGTNATVGGGDWNTASAEYATVGGGANNTAGGFEAAVGGGMNNTASSPAATVAGGYANSATNAYTTVPGGLHNLAGGKYSLAAGYSAAALHDGSFVWADSQDTNFVSTATNQFLIRAGGGVGINKNNPAAALDVSGSVLANGFTGDGSGLTNLNASQLASGAVSDGRLSGNVALRSGGNAFTGQQSVMGGNVGIGTTTPEEALTIFGDQAGWTTIKLNNPSAANNAGSDLEFFEGSQKKAAVFCANSGNTWPLVGTNGMAIWNWKGPISLESLNGSPTYLNAFGTGNVGIGTATPASKLEVAGTVLAQALGIGVPPASPYSLDVSATQAAGRFVTTNNQFGSVLELDNSTPGFIYYGAINFQNGDGQIGYQTNKLMSFSTAGAGRMYITTDGNVGIGTSNPTNKLHVAGGVSATVFVSTSDRNAKQDFAPVSPAEVLAKVAVLPISKWSFKELPGQTHLGPMAQDFHAAFGLGAGDTGIATVDADGVALAAIQGLNEKVESGKQKAENRMERLEAENAELKRGFRQKETEITELKQQLKELKQLVVKASTNEERTQP